jgi:hypothetical protein
LYRPEIFIFKLTNFQIFKFVSLKLKPSPMSLLNAGKNNNKDKKKGGQTAKPSGGFAAPQAGKGNTKSAAKNTRVTGRAQRGS